MARKKKEDEVTEEVAPVKFKNMCKGDFTLPGLTWEKGQSLPVTDEMADSKKFKHAVKIGVLKKG